MSLPFQTSLLCAALLLTLNQAATAQDRHATPETKEDTSKDLPIPAEITSVTEHQQTINGQAIHYTATAGNLLIA